MAEEEKSSFRRVLLSASSLHVHLNSALFLHFFNQCQEFIAEFCIRLCSLNGLVIEFKRDAALRYRIFYFLLKLLLYLLSFFRILQIGKLLAVLRFQLL